MSSNSSSCNAAALFGSARCVVQSCAVSQLEHTNAPFSARSELILNAY